MRHPNYMNVITLQTQTSVQRKSKSLTSSGSCGITNLCLTSKCKHTAWLSKHAVHTELNTTSQGSAECLKAGTVMCVCSISRGTRCCSVRVCRSCTALCRLSRCPGQLQAPTPLPDHSMTDPSPLTTCLPCGRQSHERRMCQPHDRAAASCWDKCSGGRRRSQELR